MQTLGFAMMDPDQIKVVRLNSIVAFGKGSRLLNSPYKFKWKGLDNGPASLNPNVLIRSHLAKKKIKIKIKTGWY